jgi:hypothetical protein
MTDRETSQNNQVGLGNERPDDLLSIAPDPLGVGDGVGFPESQNQPHGGKRPAEGGDMWRPNLGGGGGADDGVDWEDRQRIGGPSET